MLLLNDLFFFSAQREDVADLLEESEQDDSIEEKHTVDMNENNDEHNKQTLNDKKTKAKALQPARKNTKAKTKSKKVVRQNSRPAPPVLTIKLYANFLDHPDARTHLSKRRKREWIRLTFDSDMVSVDKPHESWSNISEKLTSTYWNTIERERHCTVRQESR